MNAFDVECRGLAYYVVQGNLVVNFDAVEDLTNDGFFYIELQFNLTGKLPYVKWVRSLLELGRVLQIVNLSWKIKSGGVNVNTQADFVRKAFAQSQ